MSFGFKCFDSGANIVTDSSQQTHSLIKLDKFSITLQPSSASGSTYPSSYIYDLVGVSSTADLRDNFIIGRVAGGGGIVFGGSGNFVITYHSAGKIKFENNSSCTTLFGAYRQCTYLDAVTNTYEIYSIGAPIP